MADSNRQREPALTTIGIDFGTSAVRAAVCIAGEPRPIRTPDGADEIAGCVSFAAGGPHVGNAARNFAVLNPRDTVCDVKSWLLAERAEALPALLRACGPTTELGAHGAWQLRAGGEARSPVSVAVVLLRRVLELATQEFGHAPRAALFTHPFTANTALDAALRTAAGEIGLGSVGFVAEQLAAAARLCSTDRVRPVFIADLGASHTTISVVEVGPDLPPKLLHAVTDPVGGDCVTLAIMRRATGGRDPDSLPIGMSELLRQYCEQMKRDLATVETAHCSVPAMFVPALGCAEELSLDRAGLREASGPLLHAIEDCCARALGGSGLAHSDVELYVMGGSSRLPLVSALVEQHLGTRARVSRVSNVVALGAAKLAAEKPPTRAVDDVRTRASWRPPARVQLTSPRSPLPVVIRTSPMPAPAPRDPDSLRIPAARVPHFADAAPLAPAENPRPPSQPAAPPSQPATESRASAAPATSQRLSMQSIGPHQIASGHLHNPITPADLLALPIARPMRDSDLEPIALPLLLLLTGNKRRTGTLVLHMDGALPLRVVFIEGRPAVAPSELMAIGERFKLAVGSYQFDEGRPDAGTRKPQPALAVVVAGLRQLLRSFDEASMKRALGERLDRSPEVSASDQLRTGSLGLTAIETRTVNFSLTGRNTGHDLIEHSGVGPHSVLSLLMLLDVFALIQWKTPEVSVQEHSVTDELNARARKLEAANYFQVLGVHWSATGSEIALAYGKLVTELAEGQPVFALAPDACRRMLARIELAHRGLADDLRRDAYRRRTYPDINFRGVEDLLEKKQRSLDMQDDSSEQAREVRERMQEIGRARLKKKPGTP